MNVTIKVIAHDKQRYSTCGDWIYDEQGDLWILVSRLGNWRYEMLIALHELVEVLACRHYRISQKRVDAFDIAFEKRRQAGNTDEPGDDDKAPYRIQHLLATGIEKIIAALLGVSWKKYANAIESLSAGCDKPASVSG